MFDRSTWNTDRGANKVGVKAASTFKGFCSTHDDKLFSPIEKESFCGTLPQTVLLGYRAICYEFLMKEYLLNVDNVLMDKGHSIPFQQVHQEALIIRDLGGAKAIEELSTLKRLYEEMFLTEKYDNLGHYMVMFDSIPEVMCSGVVQATHDFRGKRIAELGHLNSPAD